MRNGFAIFSRKTMDSPMHKIIITFFLLLTLTNSLLARNIDINRIVKDSLKNNTHLFIFLHRTDCGYCESMLMFTLDDDPIKELISKDFVYLQINISEDDIIKYKNFTGNGRAFAKQVGYNIYPSSLFLNSDNEIIYATAGYQDKEQFMVTLRYVNSGAYKTMGYKTFKNTKQGR